MEQRFGVAVPPPADPAAALDRLVATAAGLRDGCGDALDAINPGAFERAKRAALGHGGARAGAGRRAGMPAFNRDRTPPTAARDAEIVRRRLAGERPTALAREFRITPSRVAQLVKRAAAPHAAGVAARQE